jgi:hypothetical protein
METLTPKGFHSHHHATKISHRKYPQSPHAIVDVPEALHTHHHLPQPQAGDAVNPVGAIPEPVMPLTPRHL